ncbi:MAG: alkylated DNA repair dioxygenase AlkB, partial [Psychrobacter okhotskensis]
GYLPNNCLVNYYLDGSSKMGFHSDDTSQLADGTGVAILSLGGGSRYAL